MKYIYKYALSTVLMLFGLLISSCEKLLDKEIPEFELVGENAIIDERTALNALNGAYAFLQYDPNNSSVYNSTFSFEVAVNGAQIAGLLSGGQRFTFDRSLRYHAVVESDNILPPFYRQLYRLVNASNNVIHYTSAIPASKIREEVRTRILAEARFLRGFGHFWLLKYFGYHWDLNSEFGVVVRKEPTNLGNLIQKRENVKDTYDAIIEDYQFCIDNTEGAQTSVYQISHTAAKAFLAEALIMRQADGDMQRVITLANEILLSGHFLMEPTFEAIFVPSNDYRPSRELLFSRALNTQVLGDILSGTGSFSYRVFHNAVGSGGVVYYPSDDTGNHYAGLLESDARGQHTWKEMPVVLGNPPTERTDLAFAKVWRANANCPVYFMRLAQVLLMKAEALLNTNGSVREIIDILNQLRSRSGNSLYTEGDFAGANGRFALREAIVNEYVMELGVENGSELFAMIRNKDLGGSRLIGKYNINYQIDASLTLPIPQEEVVLNKGQVIQNPLIN